MKDPLLQLHVSFGGAGQVCHGQAVETADTAEDAEDTGFDSVFGADDRPPSQRQQGPDGGLAAWWGSPGSHDGNRESPHWHWFAQLSALIAIRTTAASAAYTPSSTTVTDIVVSIVTTIAFLLVPQL